MSDWLDRAADTQCFDVREGFVFKEDIENKKYGRTEFYENCTFDFRIETQK